MENWRVKVETENLASVDTYHTTDADKGSVFHDITAIPTVESGLNSVKLRSVLWGRNILLVIEQYNNNIWHFKNMLL